MPTWEVFDRAERSVGDAPAVSIQRRGILALNAAAYHALGDPDRVELLYDRGERLIGIRPGYAVGSTTLPVTLQSNGRPTPAHVSGGLFLKRFGLQDLVGFRWPATAVDGVLCLDVSQPGVPIRRGPQRDDGRSDTGE